MPIMDESKIVILLLRPRILSTSANNNARRAATSSAIPVDITWIPLELNHKDTTTATKTFNSCNPIDPLGININFTQRSNYSQKCVRKPFFRKLKKYKKRRNSRRIKDNNNNYVYEKHEVKKGYISPDFINKYNLLEIYHPADWFKAFLLNCADKVNKYSTDFWTTYTNLKGLLPNIGYSRRSYSKIKPFIPIKMIAFIGLIILNELIPSMRFKHKRYYGW